MNPLASAHKVLLWLLIAYIGGFLFWPLLVILIPFQLVAQWKVNRLLGWSPLATGMAAVGTLLPFAGAISLLTSEQAARGHLRETGVTVGFWGAVSESKHVTVFNVILVIVLWAWCLALVIFLGYIAREYYAGRLPQGKAGVAFWGMVFLGKSLQVAGDESILLYRRIKESGRL